MRRSRSYYLFTYLMFIEEMAGLPHHMCKEEPRAALQWLPIPKNERVGEQDHSNGRPEVPKLVNGMVMRNLNIDMFIFHYLFVVKLGVVFDESSHESQEEFGPCR